MNEDVIITIGAHNDDYILGAGATLAKYAEDGKRIINIIFSYGEKGNPLHKEEVVRDTRLKESLNADKVIGGKEIIFLGLEEGKFLDTFEDKKAFLLRILNKYKPYRIFTHSNDDPHFDHRAVHKIVMSLELDFRPQILMFDVWNIINVSKRNKTRIVERIEDRHLRKKVQSFRKHKSQVMVIFLFLWLIHAKAYMHGIMNGFKLAEVFYKAK